VRFPVLVTVLISVFARHQNHTLILSDNCRTESYSSRTPVTDSDLFALDDDGHLPAPPALCRHIMNTGGVLDDIAVIDLVTLLFVGLPGLHRIGSTELSVDDNCSHGIPPVIVIVIITVAVMVINAVFLESLRIIIDETDNHFKLD
jgi:hypothetical protein